MSLVHPDAGDAVTPLGQRSETALVLPDGLDYDDWLAAGQPLLAAGESLNWWLGDWLRYGERCYGAGPARSWASLTGHSLGTLANVQTVAEAVPPERRRADLSWSHHREVAALDPEAQTAWLNSAAEAGWSKDQLVQAMRATKAEAVAVDDHPTSTSPATKVEFGVRVVVRGERAHADLLQAATAAAGDQLRDHAHDIATRLRTHLADAGISGIVDVR